MLKNTPLEAAWGYFLAWELKMLKKHASGGSLGLSSGLGVEYAKKHCSESSLVLFSK